MTTPEFTIDWPYGWHTRAAQDVEIYCTDVPGAWPIHGHIEGCSLPSAWTASGRFLWPDEETSPHDLINRPAPTVSVPVDKLHDATMIGSLVLDRTILIPKECDIECGSSRPIKWFYADEVEVAP